MMKLLRSILVFSLLFSLVCPVQDSVVRMALLVSADDGGAEREKLKYASTDAAAMMDVLKNTGGVMQENCVYLENPGPQKIMDALVYFSNRTSAPEIGPDGAELVFYYSGHADIDGFLLEKEKLPYKDFREALDSVTARVKVVVIDSCYSGAFARMKGGSRQSPFLTIESSRDISGHAFLTSSAYDEGSQESDIIRGSYFTHYVVSGLRGAADRNIDGRISLNELYNFAYAETLAGTEKTEGGAQHPGFNIQMTGSGDLILSDLRKATSAVELLRNMRGSFYIRNADGRMISEVDKEADIKVTLALEPGRYKIIQNKGGRTYNVDLSLKTNDRLVLSRNHFTEVPNEEAVYKGQFGPLVKSRAFECIIPRFFVDVNIPTGDFKAEMADFNYVLLGGGISFKLKYFNFDLSLAGNKRKQLSRPVDFPGGVTGEDIIDMAFFKLMSDYSLVYFNRYQAFNAYINAGIGLISKRTIYFNLDWADDELLEVSPSFRLGAGFNITLARYNVLNFELGVNFESMVACYGKETSYWGNPEYSREIVKLIPFYLKFSVGVPVYPR